MDKRLRRAPYAEWVLMYQLGLSRKRISALVRVSPAVVGYHLRVARQLHPTLEAEHQAAASDAPVPEPSSIDVSRMEAVISWVFAEGRLPDGRSSNRDERSMARWLSRRRSEAADGSLNAVYSEGLTQVRGWAQSRREFADDARWHERLAQLVVFRDEGNDWPRHHDFDSEREHTLGVWIHTQRYKRRRGVLDPVRITLLDAALPGWETGRTRGRPPLR